MRKVFNLLALVMFLSGAFFVFKTVEANGLPLATNAFKPQSVQAEKAKSNAVETILQQRRLAKDINDNNLSEINAPQAKMIRLKKLQDNGLGFEVDKSGNLQSINKHQKKITLSKKVKNSDEASIQFVRDYGADFGLASADKKLSKATIKKDHKNVKHYRYQRIHNGLPVLGSSVMVNIKGTEVESASGKVTEITNLNTTPRLNTNSAKTAVIKIAKEKFKMKSPVIKSSQLAIYNPKFYHQNSDINYLAYEIDVIDNSDSSNTQQLIIDGNNGNLLSASSLVFQSLKRRIYNCNGTTTCTDNRNKTSSLSGRFENDPKVSNVIVNNVYEAVGTAYNYFQETFGLDGANDYGGITFNSPPGQKEYYTDVNANHYDDGKSWAAYYNPYFGITVFYDEVPDYIFSMIYHEYSHAVNRNKGANISSSYIGESAIIEEFYADYFAHRIIQWQIDDDTYWLGRTAIRSFKYSPTLPETHYDSRFSCSHEDRYDNLHVLGYLAYLLSQGGELAGCYIEPVGTDVMQNILYLALDYIADNVDFSGFYTAVKNVCHSTYGDDICKKVIYAMKVAQLDHPGKCMDPNENQDDGRHCDGYGRRIEEKSDQYWCSYYKYECGDDQINENGKLRVINCGPCPNSDDICVNHKCQQCVGETEELLCMLYELECSTWKVMDGCNKNRTINCGSSCPLGRVCDKTNGKCIANKTPEGSGGYYNSYGAPNRGGYYKAVTIGETTVLKDNFNSGNLINLGQVQGANNKSCYQNSNEQCWQIGGLYQWHTAMNLPANCDSEDCNSLISSVNHRGICPQGYHVPTDSEWSQLEEEVRTTHDRSCNPGRSNAYDCADAGSELFTAGENDFSAKVFNAYSLGNYINKTQFLSTSQNNANQIWNRELMNNIGGEYKGQDSILSVNNSIGRMASNKKDYHALRCFADCTKQDGEWSDWLPVGDCGDFKPNLQIQYRKCTKRSCGGQACVGERRREITCNQASCGGMVKGEGGPWTVYGDKPRENSLTSAKTGYYRSLMLGGNCWFKDDVINEGKSEFTWVEATGQDFRNQESGYNANLKYQSTDKYYLGSEKVKGLCPSGWRVPSDKEWLTIHRNDYNLACVTNPYGLNHSLYASNAGICRYIKTRECYPDCGGSGFEASSKGASDGYWSAQGFLGRSDRWYQYDDYYKLYLFGNLAGGVPKDENVYFPQGDIGWARYNITHPLRCIKGCVPINGAWSLTWRPDGACGEYRPNAQKLVRDCNNPYPECGGKDCTGDRVKYERCTPIQDCGLVAWQGGPYDADGVTRNQGGFYRTVMIGDQCWLRDNLNVGVEIPNTGNNLNNNPQINNQIIEKYCEDKVGISNLAPQNCLEYGGLYQWSQAMNLPFACSINSDLTNSNCQVNSVHQGICPTGWHIPNLDETKILEEYLWVRQINTRCNYLRLSYETSTELENCYRAGESVNFNGSAGLDAYYGPNKWSSYYQYKAPGGKITFHGDKNVFTFWLADSVYDFDWDPINDARLEIEPPGANSAYDRLSISADSGLYSLQSNKLSALRVRCIKDENCIRVGDMGLDDPSKRITDSINYLSVSLLNSIQSIRLSLNNFYQLYGSYPINLVTLNPQYLTIPVTYQPVLQTTVSHPSTNFNNYNLNYQITAKEFCDVPLGPYTATANSIGFTSQTLNNQPQVISPATPQSPGPVNGALTTEQLNQLVNPK